MDRAGDSIPCTINPRRSRKIHLTADRMSPWVGWGSSLLFPDTFFRSYLCAIWSRNDAHLFPLPLSVAALICRFWSEHDLSRPSPKSAKLPSGASKRTPLPNICSGKKKPHSKGKAIIQTPKVNLRVTLNWKRGGVRMANVHYCVSACVELGSMWLNHISPLCAQTCCSYSSEVKFCWCKWFTVFVGNNSVADVSRGCSFHLYPKHYSGVTVTWIKHF